MGQVSLDQLQARGGKTPEEEEEEPSSNNNDSEDVETEEFVSDCNETQAENPAENNTREKTTLQTEEACQKQEQDGQNEENPAESSVSDLQCENTQQNSAVQEKQDPQEQAAEEAAEGGSTTCGVTAEQGAHNKAQKHRTLDIDAKLIHNIQLYIHKTHRRAEQDTTVKTEDIETDVVDNIQSEKILLDAKNKTISAQAKKNEMQANDSRALESFTAERHFSDTFTNCKQEVHHQEHTDEVRDRYEDMPELENEYLKEEMQPLGCCKEEDENDHLEEKQDREDEMITEDDENRGTTQKQEEEEDGMEEAGDTHVPKGKILH